MLYAMFYNINLPPIVFFAFFTKHDIMSIRILWLLLLFPYFKFDRNQYFNITFEYEISYFIIFIMMFLYTCYKFRRPFEKIE